MLNKDQIQELSAYCGMLEGNMVSVIEYYNQQEIEDAIVIPCNDRICICEVDGGKIDIPYDEISNIAINTLEVFEELEISINFNMYGIQFSINNLLQ